MQRQPVRSYVVHVCAVCLLSVQPGRLPRTLVARKTLNHPPLRSPSPPLLYMRSQPAKLTSKPLLTAVCACCPPPHTRPLNTLQHTQCNNITPHLTQLDAIPAFHEPDSHDGWACFQRWHASSCYNVTFLAVAELIKCWFANISTMEIRRGNAAELLARGYFYKTL